MKNILPLLVLALVTFSQCKKEEPTPASPSVDDFIGYWNNYDHFYHQPVLDTLFRDTSMFIMFDLAVENATQLKRHSHAGGAALQYNYTRTETELTLALSGTNITYKIAKLTADSMILESKPGPTGGIPFPQDEKDVWYFVK